MFEEPYEYAQSAAASHLENGIPSTYPFSNNPGSGQEAFKKDGRLPTPSPLP